MLKKLSEEDFLVLRGPLESGRQRPKSLAAISLLCIPLQALMLYVEYYMGTWSSYPYKDEVLEVHIWVSSILAILSLIYMIPAVYMRSQKIQYLLSILISQNLFGVSFYLPALVVIGQETDDTAGLLTLTYMTLGIGALVFLVTCIRFYILLKNGAYRKGSKKDKLRTKYEKGTKSILPVVITGGMGVVFIMQYLMRNFDLMNIDTIFMTTLIFVIFWTMLFVLPEQLVILYCKFRFDSFNFEQTGRIKPARDKEGNIIA